MRLRVIIIGIIFCLTCITENTVSIILTTTLLTGFMGGYLIGRMRLGTFLGLLATNNTLLPSVNVPSVITSLITRNEEQNIVNTQPVLVETKSTLTETKTQLPITPVDVPLSLDNKIRDRFIRQLAMMDPLNCLPKIFCEVSSDPFGTALTIDHGTIAAISPINQATITKEELTAYETKLQSHAKTTTEAATVNDEVSQSDKNDSDENSDSEEDSDEEDSFEQYRKEHEHKLEMQALEEMVDDIEDPMTYYYVLQDKKKRKEKRKKNKNKGGGQKTSFKHNFPLRPGPMMSAFPILMNRRMGAEHPPPPVYVSHVMARPETSLDDMFADDPFFIDFKNPSGRNSRESKMYGYRRSKNVKEGASSDEKENVMQNYKIAFLVAEKYKSPSVCSIAFPTCPYQTKTILSVVNRLESGLLPLGGGAVEKKKNDNLEQFKNTLLAIERLNKATLQVKKRGEAINIERLTEMASRPSLLNLETQTSQKIVNEFQEVAAKIGTGKLKRKHKRKHSSKSQTQRRHYDVDHYYKKAGLGITPKPKIKAGSVLTTTVPTHDDEKNITAWDHLPTFNQTYMEMFKPAPVKSKRPNYSKSTVYETGVPPPPLGNLTLTSMEKISKPIKKIVVTEEDDEKDAKDSEDAVNVLISKHKPKKSPLVFT